MVIKESISVHELKGFEHFLKYKGCWSFEVPRSMHFGFVKLEITIPKENEERAEKLLQEIKDYINQANSIGW